MMVVPVEQLMEMVVVLPLLQTILMVEQKMVLDMPVVTAAVELQDMDLVVVEVPVVPVLMDLLADKLQLLEVTEHQIAF
tara:strand:- start:190 stop:426 length:237 start_codon:yes stop_codon:yes gene_type:complete